MREFRGFSDDMFQTFQENFQPVLMVGDIANKLKEGLTQDITPLPSFGSGTSNQISLTQENNFEGLGNVDSAEMQKLIDESNQQMMEDLERLLKE